MIYFLLIKFRNAITGLTLTIFGMGFAVIDETPTLAGVTPILDEPPRDEGSHRKSPRTSEIGG